MSNSIFQVGDLIQDTQGDPEPDFRFLGRIIAFENGSYKIFWIGENIDPKYQFVLYSQNIIETFYEKVRS